MANAVTVKMAELEKLLPRSYRLVHNGWRLDVWQFSGAPASCSQYETSNAACEAAQKFANLIHSNVEDSIFLYGPS
jgi:hypothetical protein